METRRTKYGAYVPSDVEKLNAPFKKYVKGKRFLDLGSGDGKVVLLASSYGAEAQGIEIEKDFYKNSSQKESIKQGNFFDYNWGDYEVIYYFLKGSNEEERIKDKLNKEFKGILILYYLMEKHLGEFIKGTNCKLTEEFDNVKVYLMKY